MSHSPIVPLALAALAGCPSPSQVRLGLGADEGSSAQELSAQVARLEVVVDCRDGLAGVGSAGPRPEGGEAQDWDGDGALEVVFSYQHQSGRQLPRLELDIEENAGRSLEFRVLGYSGDGALIAYGGSSWTPTVSEVKELSVPFRLLAWARPPQVVLVLPPEDPGSKVPANLAAVTLVFSTVIDQGTAAGAVHFSGPFGEEDFDLKWELATLNKGGPLEEQRTVLNLKPRGLLITGHYTVRVDPSLKSALGRGFDQDPQAEGAQPFSSGFEAVLGIGVPVKCVECGPGYACDPDGRCAVVPGCAQGCAAGMVCDAAAQCVEDCALVGLCPSPAQRCDAASKLCR